MEFYDAFTRAHARASGPSLYAKETGKVEKWLKRGE